MVCKWMRYAALLVLLSMIGGAATASAALSFGALMRSVNLYVKQDNWEKAHELLLQALEARPDDEEANYLMGFYYGLEGDYVTLTEYWDRSLAKGKKKRNDIERNRDAYFRNNFNDAISMYNEAVELVQDEEAGEEMMELFEEAVDGFRIAMVIKPDDPRSIAPLSKSLLMLGETEEAEKLFIKVLERNPEDGSSHEALGNIYYDNAEADDNTAIYRKGVTHFEKALEQKPDDLDLMRNVIRGYLALEETEKASSVFQEAIKKNPKDPDLRMSYAQILDQQGDADGAIAQFEEVITLSPDNANAFINVANYFNKQQKFEEAIPYLKRLTELLPDNAGVWSMLGVSYGQTGQNALAMEAMRKAESLEK